jgi:hypothetical protein
VLKEPIANLPVSRFAAQDAAPPPAPKRPPSPAVDKTPPPAAVKETAPGSAAEAPDPPAWQLRKVKIVPTDASPAVAETVSKAAKEDTVYTLRVYPRAEGTEGMNHTQRVNHLESGC